MDVLIIAFGLTAIVSSLFLLGHLICEALMRIMEEEDDD